MKTTYTVFHPNGTVGHGEVEWPEKPGYKLMRPLIEQIVGTPMEHVTVLYKGKRADMFVNEYGHIQIPPLAFNEAATAIYHAAARDRGATIDEDAPVIVGVAVVFDRIVWT